MSSKTETKAINLLNLKKDLSTLFLPIIRHRGNRYAKEGRVSLEKINSRAIKAKVRGSVFYRVFVDLKEKDKGTVRIGCTCPFFKQGIPCKHIWASIVEAEGYYRQHEEEVKESSRSVLEINEIFDPRAWSRQGLEPWRPVQDFVLRYEALINDNIIQVSAFEQYIKKNGEPGRIRKVHSKVLSRPGLPRADRLILPFLASLSGYSRFPYGYGFDPFRDNFKSVALSPADAATMLPLLAETGRCTVIGPEGEIFADPLGLPAGKKAKFTISAKTDKAAKVKMEPEITLEDEKVKARDVLLVNSSPLMAIYKGLLYEVSGPSFDLARKMVKGGIEKAPKNKMPELVRQAIKVSRVDHLEMPDDILPETVGGIEPVGLLVLRVADSEIIGSPFFVYDDMRVDPGTDDELIFNEDKWIFIKRDLEKERRILSIIKKSGFRAEKGKGLCLDFESAPYALSELEKAGLRLEAENGRPFKAGRVRRMSISSGIDWFDMDAEIDFGTESVPLPRVVAAFLKGKRTVRLDSGGKGVLPSRWLEKHRRILELARSEKAEDGSSVLRFPSSHALMIEHLLQEAQEAETDQHFDQIRKKLRNFKGIKPIKAPRGLKGRLRPYQEEALGWFQFLYELGLGGILADDMGLGKTVQVLAWLERQKEAGQHSTSLIVAPTSLVFNWQAEAERFTPDLRIAVYVGTDRSRHLENTEGVDIILTTYGIVRRDIKKLRDFTFDYCILDESQYIKNPDSLTAKACRLIPARRRLCLTGTPIENHLGELWSQMEFLNPGILGRKDHYMERFAKPAANGNKEVLKTLKKIVTPFILRRTKEEVAKELPDKMESIIRCTMTREQREFYRQIRDHYKSSILETVEKKGVGRSKIMVLEGLLRLRQAANHPALLGAADCSSGKFQQLLELLSESIDGGHKVLIFSQFTKMLKLIKDELIARNIPFEYLDGRTPQAKRKERVKNFQENPEIRAFLISLKAGGFGLNLTAADYVFIVDPWWNPAVELQAIDRTHRIGQTRKVVTYRLISKDSVEEKVLSLQKKKQEIVGSILSGSRNLLTNLTRKDLEILFS